MAGEMNARDPERKVPDNPCLHLGLEQALAWQFYRHARTPRYRITQDLKYILDFLIAVLLLGALGPLLLTAGLLIRLSSAGPVLNRSIRIGIDRRPFEMLTFRIPPNRTGAFIRLLHLDELPLFINVFRGEMSLVGPQPLIPRESNLLAFPFNLRHRLPPGITGPWRRPGINCRQLCHLEMKYMLEWSLREDIVILFDTVFRRRKKPA